MINWVFGSQYCLSHLLKPRLRSWLNSMTTTLPRLGVDQRPSPSASLSRMLDDFSHELESTQSRLDNVMKKLAKASHMTSGMYGVSSIRILNSGNTVSGGSLTSVSIQIPFLWHIFPRVDCTQLVVVGGFSLQLQILFYLFFLFPHPNRELILKWKQEASYCFSWTDFIERKATTISDEVPFQIKFKLFTFKSIVNIPANLHQDGDEEVTFSKLVAM